MEMIVKTPHTHPVTLHEQDGPLSQQEFASCMILSMPRMSEIWGSLGHLVVWLLWEEEEQAFNISPSLPPSSSLSLVILEGLHLRFGVRLFLKLQIAAH